MLRAPLFVLLGLILAAAGAWWLWGGRLSWLPASRFHTRASLPTRLVIGLVHLVLGYHVIVWQVAPGRRPPHLDESKWVWLIAGSVGAILGSMGLDRLERTGDPPDPSDGPERD